MRFLFEANGDRRTNKVATLVSYTIADAMNAFMAALRAHLTNLMMPHACSGDDPGSRKSLEMLEIFDGLLVDYCRRRNAGFILRGLRAVSDFEFEFQIGLANMDMATDIETVFLLTEPRNIFISSSLVKEIASNGGDVSKYVPKQAHDALMKALSA